MYATVRRYTANAGTGHGAPCERPHQRCLRAFSLDRAARGAPSFLLTVPSMKAMTVTAMALLLSGSSVLAQRTQVAPRANGEQAVLAVVQKTTEALRHNDADALSAVLAEDYYYTGPRGNVLDKRAQVEALRNGTTKFEALTTSDERVRMFTDVAVVTLVRHQKGRGTAGPLAEEARAIQVFARRHGRWLMVVSQQTNVQQ
jgi:Ketosteroid isomerase homolog